MLQIALELMHAEMWTKSGYEIPAAKASGAGFCV
jgi:hypothetical protein